MRSICSAFACLFLICFGARAQSDQENLTDTISDPAGAMIPTAPIEAKKTQVRTVFQVSSSPTSTSWNQFVPALQQNYRDLEAVMNLVGADLEKMPEGLSIQSILAVRNADASLKKMVKSWRRFKKTIL